jgi:hypothetical protein
MFKQGKIEKEAGGLPGGKYCILVSSGRSRLPKHFSRFDKKEVRQYASRRWSWSVGDGSHDRTWDRLLNGLLHFRLCEYHRRIWLRYGFGSWLGWRLEAAELVLCQQVARLGLILICTCLGSATGCRVWPLRRADDAGAGGRASQDAGWVAKGTTGRHQPAQCRA